MTDTGDGCLDKDDIAVLRSGWISVIIPPPSMHSQIPLVYFDDTKVEGDPIDQKLRVLLYVFSNLGADITTQRQGVFLMHNKMNNKIVSIPAMMVHLDTLKRALPVRIAKGIIMKSNNVERGSLNEMVKTRLFQTQAKFFGTSVPQFVVSESTASVAQDLAASLTIHPTCVPRDIGGQWDYVRLMEWQVRVGKTASSSDPPASMSLLRASSSGDGSSMATASTGGTDSQRDEELSRMRNALYARRSYQRKKTKENDIEQEAQRLEEEQERLLAENERLQLFLRQALALEQSLLDATLNAQEEGSFQPTPFPPDASGGFDF